VRAGEKVESRLVAEEEGKLRRRGNGREGGNISPPCAIQDKILGAL
jgi:hypothetical protein